MKQHVFVLGVVIAATVGGCLGKEPSAGEYALPFNVWPPNGVPYVSADNEVFPSYDERAILTWLGVVC